jgi:fatty-acyl-CoA synthase
MDQYAHPLPAAGVSTSWILGVDALPAHVDPESTALRWVDGERSYAQLRARARSLAAALRGSGLEPGDRVAAHLFNRGETFELYFACAYAGLTLVPISFRLTAREIGLIVEDAEPKIIFTQAELAEVLGDGVASAAGVDPAVVVLEDHSSGAEFESMATAQEEKGLLGHTDIQLILYTSGTTGRPKGVVLRHQNIMWCAMQQATFYRWMDADTVTMLTGPMYNTAALNEQSIPTFLVGGTVTIMPSRGWKPDAMAELMDRWQVTHALIYPSMMEPMLVADRVAEIGLRSLMFALTGGENCPPALMARFRSRWPHVWLCVAYGSTESGIVSVISDQEIAEHPGSVGRAAGGQTFMVVGGDGQVLPPNEIGEIWTAGPSIVSGYWRAPELDAETVRDGWLKMGDLGRIDDEGHLYIEGRSKDMIISKGQNVYPAEIENVLREHPDLLDASVFGVPDSEAGEAVCACVVPKDGCTATAADIIAFVRQRLASFKKPKYVLFVDTLPRSPAGKVLKSDLVAVASGRIKEMA